MVININLKSRRKPPAWMLFVPGGLMLVLGLLIIVFPQMLQLLIGGTCIVIGLGLLAVPLRLR